MDDIEKKIKNLSFLLDSSKKKILQIYLIANLLYTSIQKMMQGCTKEAIAFNSQKKNN